MYSLISTFTVVWRDGKKIIILLLKITIKTLGEKGVWSHWSATKATKPFWANLLKRRENEETCVKVVPLLKLSLLGHAHTLSTGHDSQAESLSSVFIAISLGCRSLSSSSGLHGIRDREAKIQKREPEKREPEA